MASLVLGVAGAIIGSFFGMPQLGFLAGSLLGNLLFPSGGGQDGPRLTNLRLQGSSYGTLIPITYGKVRLAGQVIWQTDLKEHKHSSGGKGGPRLASPPAPFRRIVRAVGDGGGKGGPNVTTYTYTASWAIKFCKGPKGGLQTLLANGAIVYDTSGTLDVDNSKIPVTIYLGVETAEPDPTMEAELGVGNVPAFRDDFGLVFTDMDLGEYGNTLPQMHAVIFDAAGPIPWRVSTFTPYNYQSIAGFAGVGAQNAALENGELILSTITGTPTGAGPHVNIEASGGFTYEVHHFDLQGNFLSAETPVTGIAPAESYALGTFSIYTASNNPRIAWALGHPHTGLEVLLSAFYYDGAITASPIYSPGGTPNGFAVNNAPTYSTVNDCVYCTGGNVGAYISKFAAVSGVIFSGIPIAFYNLPGPDGGAGWTTIVDDVGDVWCCINHVVSPIHDQLFHFDKDLTLLHSWPQTEPALAHLVGEGVTFTVWNNYLCFHDGSDLFIAAYAISGTTFTLTTPGTVSGSASPSNVISLGNGYCLVADGVISLLPQSAPVTLASIVRDLSLRAGLTDADIDVSQLTDLVDGYIVSTQGDCRAQIDPLRSAFFFDAVESQGIVKFVKRGGPVAVTIPDGDLAAIEATSNQDKVPRRVETKRGSEHDLPAIVNVTYMNIDAAYENGTQQARRQVGSSQAVSSIELAIAMSDAKGKQIANVLCFGAWMGRTPVKIRATRKYSPYEPTDLISAGGYIFRVEKKSEQIGGVIEFEGVVDNPFLYLAAPAANATSGSGTTPVARKLQKTKALLLDIPLVIDTDDANGFYAAMAGALDNTWRGATLDESRDSGTIWFDVETDTVPDVMGITASVLGDFAGGNVFDRINTVTVVIGPGGGTLANASRASVLNGANAALVGDEILQFMTPSLIAPSTYVISDFLRGRQGTEYGMSTHASAERFVLLPVNDVARPFADLALPWDYKAVTIGDTLAATSVQTFTNTGARLRCYSPVQLGGGRNASGDILLSWHRRTRIGGLWLNYVDALLSESIEAYYVNIYSASYAALLRTVHVTAPSLTYDAALQTTDFGGLASPLYFGVQQIGALGPGIEARQII